jgi:hypothetical protein
MPEMEFYDGEKARPLFLQLWDIIFNIVDDTLAQMGNKDYANEIRELITQNMGTLRITTDANTRSFIFYLERPSDAGRWEEIFRVTMNNPSVPPSMN